MAARGSLTNKVLFYLNLKCAPEFDLGAHFLFSQDNVSVKMLTNPIENSSQFCNVCYLSKRGEMSDLLTIRDKVMRYTTRVFNDVKIEEDGSLTIPIGSTVIFLNVVEFTDPKVVEYRDKHNLYKFVIHAYSVVLYGVQGTPEFFKWVATEGGNFWLGQFRSVKQQSSELYNLIFEANIIADELDELELRSVLWALASTADGDDEELQQKFGGKRAQES